MTTVATVNEAAHTHEIPVTTRLFGDDHATHFRLASSSPLLDVLQEGAEKAGVTLLPSPNDPLDRLHNLHAHEVGPAIQDLEQLVGQFLSQPHATHEFAIELVPAFRVNTRWAIAASPTMTPREILALPSINLAPQDYTLYAPGSNEPLPLDTSIAVARAAVFEAQRDGRYGAAAT